MKKAFNSCPDFLKNKELYGFDWKEHLTAIPSPLVVVTSYKNNGKTNATMQSWLTFSNSSDSFYCILAAVNKYGHLYTSVKERKSMVINFPTADIYMKCYSTIKNNGFEDNEIEKAGLTAEKSVYVDAPRIKECFLNLECEYQWEKELSENGNIVIMCVKVINALMDEEYYNEQKKGRYGETGYLYNIHSPLNPDTEKREKTYVGIIQKYAANEELERGNNNAL